MAEEDLIPFNTMPKSQHIQMSKNGGRSKSVKKSEGAIFRHIKERLRNANVTDKDAAWLLERLENRSAMSADILLTLDAIKKSKLQEFANLDTQVKVGNYEVSAMKAIHGEKIQIESKSININLERTMTDEEIQEMKEFLERRN